MQKRIRAWKTNMVEPLWQEGKGFIKVRYNSNIKYRDTKEIPQTISQFKKSASATDEKVKKEKVTKNKKAKKNKK